MIFRRLTFLAVAAVLLALVHVAPASAQEEGPPGSWFEIESLNAGLGTMPDGLDRTTPRSSLESFLIAARNGNWSAAMHMLDLSDIPRGDQPGEGRARAEDFLNLLERKIVINWLGVPDRPDGMSTRGPSNDPMAGVSRRSIALWYVDLGGRPMPIRINRVKPEGADPVWVLSRQTVDHLPALGQAFGPSELEQMLPGILRQHAFWGLRWWEVAGLPIGLLITALAGWITHWLLSKGYNRNRRIAPDSLLVAVRGPIVLLVMTVVLGLLSNRLFIFSGRIETVLSPLTILGVVAAVLWLVVNAADAILAKLVSFDGAELSAVGEGQEQRRSVATKVSAARRFLLVIIAVVGAGIVLNEASVMQSLGISLLASAGTITLLMAFAGRNILSNIMASLQISLNQSARIGDRIEYQGHICSVERINFTYVQLRIWTGKRLVVPVADFVAEPFENWTMQEQNNIFLVTLRLDHRADIRPLREAYHALLDRRGIRDGDERGVLVTDHDVFGQTVLFLIPSDDPNEGWTFSCEMREALLTKAREIDSTAEPLFPDARALPEAGEAGGGGAAPSPRS
ncbi:mechanosensitive ion channel family protein [Salipiger mucosus]|uniref:Potassium efflux system KefA protein / Small-conductance mechanosensitive channel n=1 Tax=Salipiger mucosus DSM 16094 TaxID=1123237 RepID=S9Q8T7_9RHOB|nr:mechanosensitive ion channel domain-containing protein [Salipiger mucosus]EPX76023.1 Potassium efflux system KefA protein / Small-conductance mechanosensitive channel [Salipiger mucosus DSM 16094]